MVRSLIAATLLAMPGAAWACGGFFCDNIAPVEQTGEDIFFWVDEGAGTVTVHVQVQYEGPSEDFAWIVPVPSVPELAISNDSIFGLMAQQFRPFFDLRTEIEGKCRVRDGGLFGGGRNESAVADSSSSPSAPPSAGGYQDGVLVVDQGQVGPYETVTLMAQSSSELITWLQTNGFDIPSALDPVIQPYIGQGTAFVALKLQKDKDAGDLQPLALTYPGSKPTIPIQLTSVAATPDMRLRVTIAGPSRAVPESYLHLETNPWAIDWWAGGANYDEVVTLAADEAGGHGFATDFAGKPGGMYGLWSPVWDTEALAAAADVIEFLNMIQWQGYPPEQTLIDILDEHVQLPANLESQRIDVYNCPDCYSAELLAQPFDAVAAATDIEDSIVAPRKQLQDLFSDPTVTVTRMTSSLSPAEMTVDPVFTFNADLPDVDRFRSATVVHECGDERYEWEHAPRRMEIDGYPSLLLPTVAWMDDNRRGEHEYILDVQSPSNQLIEATASTRVDVVQDNVPVISKKILDFNDAHAEDRGEGGKGCGCATGGPGTAGWVLLPLVALARRRS